MIFLSLDEVVSIHEGLSKNIREHFDWIAVFKDSRGGWITIYGLVVIFLLGITARDIVFLWSECRRSFVLIAFGFFPLVSGAVGVEVLGHYGMIKPHSLQVGMEEFLEMVGGSVILVGTLAFLETITARSEENY